ncbi:MAG: hypothetical protein LBL36_02175 [Clostridiales Family XIII bacterium]|jgi:hypothetical protein|nr:hypothetical protein [Clostridiales Family XIII bacterium]
MSRIFKEKSQGKGRLAAVLVLLCLVGFLPAPAAWAAETEQITLTVRQTFNGPDAPDNSFAYLLTPLTIGAPLPTGSGAGAYTFTMRGSGEAKIGPLAFTGHGVFRYELRCVSPARPGFALDGQVYTVRVYVSNGAPPAVTIAAGSGNKVPAAVFRHSYYSGPDEPTKPHKPHKSAKPSGPDMTANLPATKNVFVTPPETSILAPRPAPPDAENPPLPGGADPTGKPHEPYADYWVFFWLAAVIALTTAICWLHKRRKAEKREK